MNVSFPLARCNEHDQLEPCPVCLQDRQETIVMTPAAPGGHSTTKLFTDRDLAIVVRAALLSIVNGLERRYQLKPKKRD